MQKFKFALLLCALPFFLSAQQTITSDIQHDGLKRGYVLYVPAMYTGNEPVPLMFNFHGFTSNASQQLFYSEFMPIADTAGFIMVLPEGTEYQGDTHFNVGGFTTGSTVDDVGFTEALLDSISAAYNIDANRVYSTGMSNGGYMSFLLACQSDRFAAVASVTGSMTPETYNACMPSHPTPVLQIHGTADIVVPYGGAGFSKSVEEVYTYWDQVNNCVATPIITDVPDINTADGSTVEHFLFENGDKGTTVEHYKITGGQHTWPFAPFAFPGTNYDIRASLEIWKFFSRYDLASLSTTNTNETISDASIKLYPNPVQDVLHIESPEGEELEMSIMNSFGQIVRTNKDLIGKNSFNVSDFEAGMYFLKVGERVFPFVKE